MRPSEEDTGRAGERRLLARLNLRRLELFRLLQQPFRGRLEREGGSRRELIRDDEQRLYARGVDVQIADHHQDSSTSQRVHHAEGRPWLDQERQRFQLVRDRRRRAQ